jgi:hypothetical protein
MNTRHEDGDSGLASLFGLAFGSDGDCGVSWFDSGRAGCGSDPNNDQMIFDGLR